MKDTIKKLLLTEAQTLFDGCTIEDNPEYLRGMSELIAGVCGSPDVTTEETAAEISDSITE